MQLQSREVGLNTVNARRGLGEAALLFLVLFMPSYLGQARGLPGTADAAPAMLDAVVVGVPQVLLVLYLLRLGGEPAERFGLVPLRPRDAPATLVAWLGGLAILAALVGGVVLAPGLRDLASGGARWRLTAAAQVPLALAGALAAGYREELFFRAYLLARLTEAGIPVGWASAVSTVLFALGHLYEGPLGVAVALSLGAWLCFVYTRTRSLHVAAVGHALWNASVLVLGLIAPGLPGS